MEKKTYKVIFIISFIPYFLLIIAGIWCSIMGFTHLFGAIAYGIEALKDTIVFYGIVFSIFIPIIPVCFLYQIIYVIKKLINKKRRGNNDNKENKTE